MSLIIVINKNNSDCGVVVCKHTINFKVTTLN